MIVCLSSGFGLQPLSLGNVGGSLYAILGELCGEVMTVKEYNALAHAESEGLGSLTFDKGFEFNLTNSTKRWNEV